MRRCVMIASILLAVLAVPALSQRDTGRCTEEHFDQLADWLIEQAELLRTGDAPRETVSAIALSANLYNAQCSDLVFTSEDLPGKKVFGPVSFSGGLYRTRMEALGSDWLNITIHSIEGPEDCGVFAGLLVTSAEDGDEELVEIAQCMALLEFSSGTFDFDRDGPEWTFSIVPVR